jgi:hypothetical protein
MPFYTPSAGQDRELPSEGSHLAPCTELIDLGTLDAVGE